MPSSKTIFAPAKVNLCLHVVAKRDDGYHNLAMLMQRISVFDRLEITLTPHRKITVDCPGLDLMDGQVNIVEAAARRLLDHVGLEQGVAISVEKHIPAAAGLGGGSSDAAAVLEALDEMLELRLPRAELMAIGSQLGADVPFFINKKTSWVTGVGDRFEPWPGLPPLGILLINPRIAVSTAEIFQNLGLTHRSAAARIPGFPVGASGLVRLLHNDLETVTCQRHPVITTIKDLMVANGAMGALMSGSGPTVFGLFQSTSLAEQAAEALQQHAEWWIKVVEPL